MGTVSHLHYPPRFESRDTELGHAVDMVLWKPLPFVLDAVAIVRSLLPEDKAGDLDWQHVTVETRPEGKRQAYGLLIPWRSVEAPRHALEEHERMVMG